MDESQRTVIERKPIMKPKPSGKFVMEDFQEEDLAKLVEDDSSANWSEMGCFKTTTAEWLWDAKLKHIPNPRVLVITNKTGKGAYFESLAEVLPEWDIFTVTPRKFNVVVGQTPIRSIGVKLPTPLYFRPVVVIAHYWCFTNRAVDPAPILDENDEPILDDNGVFKMKTPKCNVLLNYPWDMIVLDEAHRIKDPDTQWTRNIKKMKVQYKHIMTGTGFVNRPDEIWSLLNFLYPKEFTSYDRFRKYYCEIENYSGYQKVVGIKRGREDEFRELVKRVGVRRTMIEVFPDINEPIETVTKVSLSPTQKRMYEEIKLTLSTLDAKGEPLHSPSVISQLQRLRQICVATPDVVGDRYDPILERRIFDIKLVEPSSKLDAVMDILAGLEWDEERKDQLVVFSNFRDPLSLLEKRLQRANIPYLRLLPEMSESQRYTLWHDIWPKKEHQVFLSTLKLGAESINLSSAHRAVFLDQDWSPVPNNQARGRIYRPGQTGVAQFIYLRAEGTVDYRVLDTLNEKQGWFNQIFGNGGDDDDD